MVAGAANDNAVKTALVIAVSVLGWKTFGLDAVLWANAAALCFIAPFVLCASAAAHASRTRPPKSWLIQLKAFELLLALSAVGALWAESVPWLLCTVAGFGVQSAFIGPMKYALIPKLAGRERLLSHNAWMETGTFVAILAGTLWGAEWVMHRPLALMGLWLGLSVVGILALIPLPDWPVAQPSPLRPFRVLMTDVLSAPAPRSAIWCLSGFWAVGSVWLTHLPWLATEHWGLPAASVSDLLALFVVGIAIGALIGACSGRLRSDHRLLIGAFALFAGSLWTGWASQVTGPWGLVLAAAGGGYLALPLYTALQRHSRQVSDSIAANNVVNAALIVAAALGSMLAVGVMGWPVDLWLIVLAGLQLLVCLYHRGNLRLY